MLKEVFMPKLGMTMETGTIIHWFKEEGEPVQQGEVLLEVLTDKINIEVEAYHSGILLKRYYEDDAVVPVNLVIGYIGDAGDIAPNSPPDAAAGEAETQSTPAEVQASLAVELPLVAREGKPRATPAARKAARDFDVQLQMVQGSGENGRIHRADVEAFAAGRSVESSAIGSPRATPLAQKVAGANGINLDGLQGSGVHGKILREDVTRAMQSQTASVQKENAKTKRVIKLQGMRKIIAERMSQSAYTAPHVTITTSVDMSASKALRTELLPIIEKKTGLRLSYTEILLKAVSSCLIKHPSLNARWDNGEVVLEENTNIGMAVSVKDGLLVPVIFHAQTMGLSELVRAAKEAASKARDNKLKPEDLTGGTFTISNLGMYAVDSFTPIINQPEVAILGVGQIQDKPSVVNGTVEVRPMMTLSLSFDHRVVDGAPAAAFLTDLKSLLEHPYQLLV